MGMTSNIFDPGVLEFLKIHVDVHHSIDPTVPPQGIYFEALGNSEQTGRVLRMKAVAKAAALMRPCVGRIRDHTVLFAWFARFGPRAVKSAIARAGFS